MLKWIKTKLSSINRWRFNREKNERITLLEERDRMHQSLIHEYRVTHLPISSSNGFMLSGGALRKTQDMEKLVKESAEKTFTEVLTRFGTGTTADFWQTFWEHTVWEPEKGK